MGNHVKMTAGKEMEKGVKKQEEKNIAPPVPRFSLWNSIACAFHFYDIDA